MSAPVAGRRKWWTPFGLALLCGHCAVGGGIAAATALGVATLPSVAGVPLAATLPPALVLTGFAAWLWSGRAARDGDACDVGAR